MKNVIFSEDVVKQILDYIENDPEYKNMMIEHERIAKIVMDKFKIYENNFIKNLFTNPKLIILDEATSALDAETEQFVSSSINSLRGKTTVVLIAHRLATVRNADKVCYVENGQIKGFGTFDQVRRDVHNFDHQANLLGLK